MSINIPAANMNSNTISHMAKYVMSGTHIKWTKQVKESFQELVFALGKSTHVCMYMSHVYMWLNHVT